MRLRFGDQLNAMAIKFPVMRVLDETFKQTVTAVAVPLNYPLALAFAIEVSDRGRC